MKILVDGGANPRGALASAPQLQVGTSSCRRRGSEGPPPAAAGGAAGPPPPAAAAGSSWNNCSGVVRHAVTVSLQMERPPEVTDPSQCWETLQGGEGTYFYCDATRSTQYEVPSAPAYLLPLGWQVNVAPTGLPYFSRGAETSWELPSGYVALPEGADIVADLGVYWEALSDPQTGPYYYQESSGRTQRELPCAPVPPRGDTLRGKLPVVLPPSWFAAASASGEVYFAREDGTTSWDLPPGSKTGAGPVEAARGSRAASAADGSSGSRSSRGGAAAVGGGGGGGAPRTALERARALARRALVAWVAERRRGRRGRIIQHRPRLFYHHETDAYILVNPLGEAGQLRRMLDNREYEHLGTLGVRDAERFGFAKENAAATAAKGRGRCFTSAVDPATGREYYYVEGESGGGMVRRVAHLPHTRTAQFCASFIPCPHPPPSILPHPPDPPPPPLHTHTHFAARVELTRGWDSHCAGPAPHARARKGVPPNCCGARETGGAARGRCRAPQQRQAAGSAQPIGVDACQRGRILFFGAVGGA